MEDAKSSSALINLAPFRALRIGQKRSINSLTKAKDVRNRKCWPFGKVRQRFSCTLGQRLVEWMG